MVEPGEYADEYPAWANYPPGIYNPPEQYVTPMPYPIELSKDSSFFVSQTIQVSVGQKGKKWYSNLRARKGTIPCILPGKQG